MTEDSLLEEFGRYCCGDGLTIGHIIYYPCQCPCVCVCGGRLTVVVACGDCERGDAVREAVDQGIE